jgi:hypothetical protein
VGIDVDVAIFLVHLCGISESEVGGLDRSFWSWLSFIYCVICREGVLGVMALRA